MHTTPTAKTRPAGLAWISAITGVLGLFAFPAMIALNIQEPSNEYGEPLHTITHAGLIFPLGFVLSVGAIITGILALRRKLLGEALAITGIVTGVLGAFLTLAPTIGVIVGAITST